MRDSLPLLGAVAGTLATVAALTWAALIFAWHYESAQCQGQWARSGMRAEYSRLEGCMVQRRDGTWVPASAVRSLES